MNIDDVKYFLDNEKIRTDNAIEAYRQLSVAYHELKEKCLSLERKLSEKERLICELYIPALKAWEKKRDETVEAASGPIEIL